MGTQYISPVGRLVQGGMSLSPKKDMKGQPALDSEGKQIHECFMAIAVPKLRNGQANPDVAAFWAQLDAQARASFPHLFPNGGACTHPKFAWKIQDGDGVDDSGQSVADKPGFAGHWIFKMATRFAPSCWYYGKYDPSQRIQNPDEIIKKGYWIRVSGTIDGNGVEPGNRQAVPGLFVSPNMVELIDRGDEIISGPDPSKVFGAAALPPGITPMSTAPALPGVGGGAPNLNTPPLPGQVTSPPALPAQGVASLPLPGATTSPPTLPGAGVPSLPGVSTAPANAGFPSPPMPGQQVVQQPVYQMTASAQGATREQLHALNWTDDMLIQAGHMVRVQ